ncbi:MAG: septum formation protein Maf [Candidatus Lokiarchaeota archaeon]|nr:septum formation protein Maf [Candidatus Lokiarchaeota archaeon]MBD3202629.1 septum formation protein Maf [Candidatus Lokiarchaeota archaeon]
MRKIILASKSIDRKEILTKAKIPFSAINSDVDEGTYKKNITDPIALVKKLAEIKVLTVKNKIEKDYPDSVIIGADTIVEYGGRIIGKAKDRQEASQILKNLSGNTHNLITGIAIAESSSEKLITSYDTTSVEFLPLSDDDINHYINSNEWKGRAGAYSLREKASLIVASINGSSSNVLGLPMQKLFEILKKEFNLNLLSMN